MLVLVVVVVVLVVVIHSKYVLFRKSKVHYRWRLAHLINVAFTFKVELAPVVVELVELAELVELVKRN